MKRTNWPTCGETGSTCTRITAGRRRGGSTPSCGSAGVGCGAPFTSRGSSPTPI